MSHLDTDWMGDAACVSTDPEIFFPKSNSELSRPARRICHTCPVTAECADYALTRGLTGIWGGTGDTERRNTRRRTRRAAAA